MHGPGVILVRRFVSYKTSSSFNVSALRTSEELPKFRHQARSPRRFGTYVPHLHTRFSKNAMNLLTVAWQQRASVWKPLEDDPAVSVA